MRITHSFWTTPMKTGRWNIEGQLEKNLWLVAMALTYAKLSGAYVTMHTDSLGYKFLKNFDYDEIYVDLNGIERRMKCNPNNMWAAAKSVALANEPLGTIHTDTDVFIKSKKCLNSMNFDDADVIFQHIEQAGYKECYFLKKDMPNIDMTLKYACNVGIIGFNSEELRKEYLSNYNHYLDTLKLDEDAFFSADLILEQLFLYQLITQKKTAWKSLIGDLRVDTIADIQNNCLKLNYAHLIGQSKYEEKNQHKIKAKLKELNPELYKKMMSFDFINLNF